MLSNVLLVILLEVQRQYCASLSLTLSARIGRALHKAGVAPAGCQKRAPPIGCVGPTIITLCCSMQTQRTVATTSARMNELQLGELVHGFTALLVRASSVVFALID